MKVALYSRVSTDEQKKFGYSINTQLNELREYAKKNNYEVVGEYLDEGISGGKLNRPALNQLLDDIPNKKIELILFVKLDRWFRNVAYYYKVQETLDKYNVSWKTTQEDYETITSSGKFKVNIMLSVNQQFKDATSERIKSVMEYKAKVLKEALSTPSYGYKIENKHYVIDEDKAIHVRTLFNDLIKTHCIRQSGLNFVKNNKELTSMKTVDRILRNPIYCGNYEYKGLIIKDYYPAIISEELFNEAQEVIKTNIKMYDNGNKKKRTYIFSGLIYCPKCGKRMCGMVAKNGNKAYRCSKHFGLNTCTNNRTISESKLEKLIINKIKLDETYEITNATKKEKVKVKKENKTKEKIDRLTTLFIEGIITKDKFDLEYAKLNKEQIENKTITKEQTINLGKTIKLLEMYNSLDDEKKAEFFRNIIKEIIYEDNDVFIKYKTY